MNSETVAARQDYDSQYVFPVVAVMMLIFVFYGFAPTYYLRTAPELPVMRPSLHIHGILYSAWMVLFVVQVSLIGIGKRAIHRQLGYAGIALAIAMVVIGVVVGYEATVTNEDPYLIAVFAFGDLIIFAPLVAAAVVFRKQRDFHKRLMLCATVAIIDAGVGRWPIVTAMFTDDSRSLSGLIVMWFLTDIPLFIAAGVDLLRRGAIHAAYLWGGSAIVLSQAIKVLLLQF